MIDTKALFETAWAAEIEDRIKRAPSFKVEDYSVTGRAPAPYGKRTAAWWADKGHEFVDKWIAWRLEHPDWEVWTTPDDLTAIEWEFNVTIPGDVPVKGFVDRIFVTGVGEMVVVDIKTGRSPETAEQLGLYATALELAYGPGYRPAWGYWWDASKGAHVGPFDLSRYSPAYFASAYAETIAGMNAGCFPASPANSCKNWCGVQRFCHSTGGSEAKGVDPLAG